MTKVTDLASQPLEREPDQEDTSATAAAAAERGLPCYIERTKR